MPITNEDLVLQELMNKIVLVALEDGIITEDELAILKQVKLDIKQLRANIKRAQEDKNTTDDEVELLENFSKDLLQNAYNISKNDTVITTEERALINTLIKTITQ